MLNTAEGAAPSPPHSEGLDPGDAGAGSAVYAVSVDRVAIFAALQWECRAVLRHLRQVRRQRVGDFTTWQSTTTGREVWVVRTGIGIERAGAAAAALGDPRHFTLFVSTGCAGGLAPELAAGDLTVATSVRLSGTTAHATDDAQRAAALTAAQTAGVRAVAGPILCSPSALATARDKRAAAAAAIAVDMEGGAIAARAAAAAVPFLSVRAVLDGAADELSIPEACLDPASGSVRPLALARHVVAHPGTVAHLMALQRMQHAARESLERFFAAWLAR